MKKLIGAVILLVNFYTMDAHALFTDCQIDYTIKTTEFLIIGGGGGSGVARCKDLVGNSFDIPIHVHALGTLKVGSCEAHGHVAAVGVGFAFDEILGAQLKFDVGPMVNHGGSVGIGVSVNPIGSNVSVTGEVNSYKGACFGLADAVVITLSRDFGHEMRPVRPVAEIEDRPREVENQAYTPGGSYYASGRYYFPNGVYVENGVYYTADGVAYYANGQYLTTNNNSYPPTPLNSGYAAPVSR